eukprot:8605509-Ditylum_brightwellii.AAC.1
MAATNSSLSVHIDGLRAWIANIESESNTPGLTIPPDPNKGTVHRSNSPLAESNKKRQKGFDP